MDPTLEGIGQIAITVSDVGKVLAFYRGILGLKFLFQPADSLAFVQAGDTRIILATPQGYGAVRANSILYIFRTHGIEGMYTELIKLGAVGERVPQLAAKMPDYELWLGFLRDPDGNVVGLMEERR